MLTKEQILKVARLVDQTGENEGFYEPNFNKSVLNQFPKIGNHIVALNLIYVELPNGDVVIQKK